MSPLLYFITFLSQGELQMELRKLAWQWLRRCDRIWLHFPSGDDPDELDGTSYDMLRENQRLKDRRPVYLLHPTGDDKIVFVPVPVRRDYIDELLAVNLTAGLARRCI